MKLILLLGLVVFAVVQAEDTNFGGEESTDDEATTAAVEADAEELNVRQASRQVNCNCQCSSITFLDKFGKINGNCRTADNTGAVWCYVDPRYNQCADLQRSTRTSSMWSYQACATPDLTSPQCAGGFNNGGFNNGGFNNGGFNNNGGIPNNGGFNNGGIPNNGGFNNGGIPNNGGFNNGGIPNNGGFNNGGGIPNNGFNNNNNNGFNGGIRGTSPVVGAASPSFSLSSSSSGGGASFNPGPEGFPFQENGGFQAVVSLAERKATAAAAPTDDKAAEDSEGAVSFSR